MLVVQKPYNHLLNIEKKYYGIKIIEWKAQKGAEPNDRKYDRKFEEKVKRISPEELNELLYGEA